MRDPVSTLPPPPDFRLDAFGGAIHHPVRCPVCHPGAPTMAPTAARIVVRDDGGTVHEHFARMSFGPTAPPDPRALPPRDFASLARGGLVPPLDARDDPLAVWPPTRAEAITAIALATLITVTGGIALALISAGWLP